MKKPVASPGVPTPPGLTAHTVVVDEQSYLVLGHPWSHAPRVLLVGLTEAERDVARRLLAGEKQGDIARARRSSPRTVAVQIASIYRKAGVSSRVELALLFR